MQTIAAQHKMVSVMQAFAVDLSGQVCVDQLHGDFYSGVAAQAEFLQGASRSEGGKAIVCLAATEDDSRTSRIRPVLRTDVHYVITEYCIAYLFGKSIRERTLALIDIAHPDFRAALFEQAKALRCVGEEHTLRHMGAYAVEEVRPPRPTAGTSASCSMACPNAMSAPASSGACGDCPNATSSACATLTSTPKWPSWPSAARA